MVVVAGHEHDLRVRAQRLPDRGEDLLRGVERLGHRAVAQLERVAQDHQPVGARELGQQRLARRGVAQDVGLGAAAEVQVGDDEGPHRA